jgi:hypothetical protein
MFASNLKTIIMKIVYSISKAQKNQNTIGFKWNAKRRFK